MSRSICMCVCVCVCVQQRESLCVKNLNGPLHRLETAKTMTNGFCEKKRTFMILLFYASTFNFPLLLLFDSIQHCSSVTDSFLLLTAPPAALRLSMTLYIPLHTPDMPLLSLWLLLRSNSIQRLNFSPLLHDGDDDDDDKRSTKKKRIRINASSSCYLLLNNSRHWLRLT